MNEYERIGKSAEQLTEREAWLRETLAAKLHDDVKAAAAGVLQPCVEQGLLSHDDMKPLLAGIAKSARNRLTEAFSRASASDSV